MAATEIPKTAGEKGPERPPINDTEVDFKQGQTWQTQVEAILQSSINEKYHGQIAKIIDTFERKQDQLNPHLENISKIQINGTVIIFKNKAGKTLVSFDIKKDLLEAAEIRYREDCERCHRHSRKLRVYEFSGTPFGRMLASRLQGPRGSFRRRPGPEAQRGGAAAVTVVPPPPDPKELEATQRLRDLLTEEHVDREDILRAAEKSADDEYDLTVHMPPQLDTSDRYSFEQSWQFMDASREVYEILKEEPDKRAGYQTNPFRDLKGDRKWGLEDLRELILKGADDEISFRDVAKVIYYDRFDDIEEALEKGGVPEILRELIDDNLQNAYKKIKKLAAELKDVKDYKSCPEDLKPYYAHRDKVLSIEQMLGDYIIYANRLVNKIGELKYNPSKPTEDRERSAFELEEEIDEDAIERNRAKIALLSIFREGVETPREYTDELSHLFSSEESKRPITFQDLDGRTATARTEWFTEDQDPRAAHLLAYQEIQKQSRNPDGTWSDVVTEEATLNHLNDLLKLGIAFYDVSPKERSMKEIIEDLSKLEVEIMPGVPLRYSGRTSDILNLFHALSLKNLSDLKSNDTEKNKLINTWRKNFIRIGSVIYRENKFHAQERRESERKAKKARASLKFTDQQADTLIAGLKATNKFSDSQCAKIKSALLGGAAIALQNQGGSFTLQIPFENDVSVSFTAAFPQWENFAPGLGIGKQIDVGGDVTITIHGGAAYSFAEAAKTAGWAAGAGGSISAKILGVRARIEAGAGALVTAGAAIPTAFFGLGIDWGRYQEQYQEKLTKKQIEHHIQELNASSDPYQEVTENPSKYRGISNILNNIDSVGLKLPESSRRDLFMAAYGKFKEGLQREAIDESAPNWIERILPRGAGAGIAMVGNVPVPYFYFEFNLPWSRNLVFRIATDAQRVSQITDNEASAKILDAYKNAQKVEPAFLKIKGEIFRDPQTGELGMQYLKEGNIDFEKINQFGQFRDELSANANIFVEPADIDGENMGLLLLKPQEAHGNTRIFVDPALKDNVIVVTRGSRLYLSVKKGTQLFFKRQDINYPFEERGALEETLITISSNPHLDTKVVLDSSLWYMEQSPGSEWVKRPRRTPKTPEETELMKQENVKTFEAYVEWWGQGQKDRLEFFSTEGFHEAYDRLLAAGRVTQSHESHFEVKPTLRDFIEKLTQDEAFMRRYKELSTKGSDLVREGQETIVAKWSEDYQTLVKELQTRAANSSQKKLNEDELYVVMLELLTASFQDLQKLNPEQAKAKYEQDLNNFAYPMLLSIFNEYYKPDKDRAKKVVDWIMEQLRKIDITQTPKGVERGAAFASLVGTIKITGLRRMYNFHTTAPKHGMLGEKFLDITAKDASGEAARFWLDILSPYKIGLYKGEIPDPRFQEAAYATYQNEIYENLRSPLALKLLPFISIILTPDEMRALTKVYGKPGEARFMVNQENLGAVRKYLQWCDKVREAQVQGKNKILLEHGFHLVLDTRVSMGIFKQCGNYSGLLRENFALVHEGTQKIYFAGLAEGFIDIENRYGRIDPTFIAGLVMPQLRERVVTPEPEQPPPPPPTTEEPIPVPSVATAEPQPVPVGEVLPSPATRSTSGTQVAGGETTGGGSTAVSRTGGRRRG